MPIKKIAINDAICGERRSWPKDDFPAPVF